MKNHERDCFVTSQHKHVAVIELRNDIYELVTNIDESDVLIEYIKETEGNPDIKALLITNERGSFGEKQYDEFICRIMGPREDCEEKGPPRFLQKNIRFKEINILNKIIKVLSEYRKLCFSAINGDVVTPFLGAALSMDIRYATEGTRFIMIHNKYGLHPSGALPFFLSQYIHHSRALDLQFKMEFNTDDAVALGLVNKVFTAEKFREQCLDEIEKFMVCESSTIGVTKRLTNYTRKNLPDYFLYEASLLNL